MWKSHEELSNEYLLATYDLLDYYCSST